MISSSAVTRGSSKDSNLNIRGVTVNTNSNTRWRDVLKAKSEKTKIAWPKNEQPKMLAKYW